MLCIMSVIQILYSLHHLNYWFLDVSYYLELALLSLIFQYRFCSEGCCPQEYCAYHKICYPKMHCMYGCPDGSCQKQICMPMKPCTVDSECEIAHACSMNYNLGYKTCQYNLEIGKTLCVDRDGNSLTKPLS